MDAPHLTRAKNISAILRIILSAVVNCFDNCQVKKKVAPGYLSQDEEGRLDFAKNAHTLPLKKTCLLIPLSSRSISMGNAFNWDILRYISIQVNIEFDLNSKVTKCFFT